MIFTFKKNNHQNWEEWFAWYPVKIDNLSPNKPTGAEYREETWYWLERVCRRQFHGYGSSKKRVWSYASIFDVLMQSEARQESKDQAQSGVYYPRPSPPKPTLSQSDMLELIKTKDAQ